MFLISILSRLDRWLEVDFVSIEAFEGSVNFPPEGNFTISSKVPQMIEVPGFSQTGDSHGMVEPGICNNLI